MENRINYAVKLGRVPDEIQSSSKGFSQWESYASRKDHDTFLQVTSVAWTLQTSSLNVCIVFLIFDSLFSTSQIVIDGRDPKAKDVEGSVLPTLVYLAREKRPRYFHNFKAGAMNALVIIYLNM